MPHLITVSSGCTAVEHRQSILEPLRDFNFSRAGPANAEPLCVAVRCEDRGIQAGLYGATLYDWLAIELLFVDEGLRGAGLGSRLLAEAEQQARLRGCIGAWLDTFSFQARGFYEKQGYSLAGSIPDHPRGGARFFLMKRWPVPA